VKQTQIATHAVEHYLFSLNHNHFINRLHYHGKAARHL